MVRVRADSADPGAVRLKMGKLHGVGVADIGELGELTPMPRHGIQRRPCGLLSCTPRPESSFPALAAGVTAL